MSENQATQTATTSKVASEVGFWSAILTTVWILAFILFAFIFQNQVLTVASAFLIAPSFVVLMVSIHNCAAEEKRLWSEIALCFAVIYATTVGLNYFLYLTAVRQNPQLYTWLTMDLRPDSAFWALEVLGYTFMSLAALFATLTFSVGKVESAIRWLFVVNGVMNIVATLAVLLTANSLHALVLVSLGIWSLVFPIATILLAVVFRRTGKMNV